MGYVRQVTIGAGEATRLGRTPGCRQSAKEVLEIVVAGKALLYFAILPMTTSFISST